MNAAQINSYGGKEVMQTVNDAPKPSAGKGQVLVAVRAAAVNPFDWKVREGMMKQMADLTFPATLGGDCAGTVAEIGEGVVGFSVGEAVYGQANALSGQGSYAEFTPVKTEQLSAKPTSVDFVTAAALPLTGVSAIQALVEHAGLQAGQKVLIHGGAGGIGTYAIQLAKHLGAYVATTAAAENTEYVRGLGADEVIDYAATDFSEVLNDYDVVYDTVGGETFTKSFKVLKKGGIIVTMVARPDEGLEREYGITSIAQFTQVTTRRLAKLAELVDAGALHVNIDKVFPLDKASEALSYLQSGKHAGKVVIEVS